MLSPFHIRPGATHRSYLPGSCIFVSNCLSVDINAQCAAIENSCKLLNMTCCLVSCRHHLLAIVSVYRSPSISSVDCLLEIRNMFLNCYVLQHMLLLRVTLILTFLQRLVSSGNTLTYYWIFNLYSMFLIHLELLALPPP